VAGRGNELAQLLVNLKDRSGLSYSELGRKTHTSSSTLHRYCTGKSVPPDYRTVVGIAQACEATDRELSDLLRCWRLATDPSTKEWSQAPAEPESVPPSDPRWLRWKMPLGVVGALLGVMLLLAATASGPQIPPAPATQQINGPSWVLQRPVEPSLFGVTASSSSGAMPAFRVGSVRFWDSRTRWANLEPRPRVYDWSILDRLVGGAQQAGLPAVLVLGGTPGWAAPNGPKTP
jgi:transcriptional regulator with XRE-family HTH domain